SPRKPVPSKAASRPPGAGASPTAACNPTWRGGRTPRLKRTPREERPSRESARRAHGRGARWLAGTALAPTSIGEGPHQAHSRKEHHRDAARGALWSVQAGGGAPQRPLTG